MWLSTVLSLLALTADPAPAAVAPAPSLPEPIYTRQTLFAIPFRVGQVERPEQRPVEVDLYVSGDRGATWQLYSRAEPAKQQFMFRAGVDGEFWFLIRTLDRGGQLRPQGVNVPGLRVVVDTVPPKLQINATETDAGVISVRWQIEDSLPKFDSLKIQYRTDRDPLWQTVAMSQPAVRTGAKSQSGDVTWVPPNGTGRVEIRAEAADLAGNPVVSHAQVVLGQSQTATRPVISPVGLPSNTPPAASAAPAGRVPPGAVGGAVPPSKAPAGPVDPFAARASSRPVGLAQDDAWRASTADPPPTPWPAARADTPTQIAAAPPAVGRAGLPSERTQVNFAADPGRTSPNGAISVAINPAIRNQFEPANKPAERGEQKLPPGVTPQTLNSRSFEIKYGIDHEAARGKRIELWGTRDGGRTWKQYAVDQQHRNLFVVTVEQEGLYGFYVMVQDAAASVSRPPDVGQVPKSWIRVKLAPAGSDRALPPVQPALR